MQAEKFIEVCHNYAELGVSKLVLDKGEVVEVCFFEQFRPVQTEGLDIQRVLEEATNEELIAELKKRK